MVRYMPLLLGGVFALVFSPSFAARQPDAALKFLAYDGFDGKSGLNWKVVRPDPTHAAIGKRPNRLTLTTQQGTIHRDERARGDRPARNIYLIDNPLGPSADWTVTTCVSIVPVQPYQQAGLICYDDDDNYAKLSYTFNHPANMGQVFSFLTETAGQSKINHFAPSNGLGKVWLRLTKRGNKYEYGVSENGDSYKSYGVAAWGDGAPSRIGLIAKNGGTVVPEIDADFEFFELRSPPQP